MENIDLNCECTHNTVAQSMTCSWKDGRVVIVHSFKEATTAIYVDDELQRKDKNLSIEEFMKLQCECQLISEKIF